MTVQGADQGDRTAIQETFVEAVQQVETALQNVDSQWICPQRLPASNVVVFTYPALCHS